MARPGYRRHWFSWVSRRQKVERDGCPSRVLELRDTKSGVLEHMRRLILLLLLVLLIGGWWSGTPNPVPRFAPAGRS